MSLLVFGFFQMMHNRVAFLCLGIEAFARWFIINASGVLAAFLLVFSDGGIPAL